jgi:hypothetical protein
MLRTHRVSVSFKSIARPQERMGRHRALHAGSAQGWDLLPAGLLDSSVLQVFAHARARTCPASLRRLLAGRGRAVVLAMHRRSAGRASEIVMQPTSGASVRREPARPRRLVLMRLQEYEEPEK